MNLKHFAIAALALVSAAAFAQAPVKAEVKNVLAKSGVSNEQLETFDTHYDNTVGATSELMITNIAETRKFEVKTPDVVIKVNPERSDLVETKIIDGRKYLMIEVGSNIEVNGISLSTTDN